MKSCHVCSFGPTVKQRQSKIALTKAWRHHEHVSTPAPSSRNLIKNSLNHSLFFAFSVTAVCRSI